MESPDQIRSLLVKAREGDREAFAELIETQQESLEHYVRLRVGSHLKERVDLEDVVQETYTRGLRSLRSFEWRDSRSFQRWLRGIAENVILELAKKQRREQVIYLDRDLPAEDPTPSKKMRREERSYHFEDALGRLPSDYREVLRLSRIEGLRINEIAARMKRSPKAVSHLLSRAMTRLREEFGDTESLGLSPRSFDEEGAIDG